MKILYCCFLILLNFTLYSQSESVFNNLNYHISISQNPASFGIPSFSAIHPGINTGLNWKWNKKPNNRMTQSLNLGYFYHKDLQHAIQLYTESKFQFQLKNGLEFGPVIGGGYILSVFNISSFQFNSSTNSYEQIKFSSNHNWMIDIGLTLEKESNFKILDQRPLTFFIDYRLMVQGIFVHNTVPIIAYTPIRLGFSFPISKIENSHEK